MTYHLTDTQRTILARMSDGQSRMGMNITPQAGPLSRLCRLGLLKREAGPHGYDGSYFAITPSGLQTLEAAQ